MRSENRPKTRLLYCEIAKILAPLWAIAVAEHDVFKPDINLILSANCNKTANINVKNLSLKQCLTATRPTSHN